MKKFNFEIMEEDILEKIERFCSFVCNGKNYQYEQKLQKAAEHKLYDAAIIYAWNIFMLFVYEKVWQIRGVEKEDNGENFRTDKKAFLSKIDPNHPDKFSDDYLDGHLCNLNKLHEQNKGEDFIIGRMKDVYPNVDQQYFKKAQIILKSRHDGAHINELQQDIEDLRNVIRVLIQIMEAIQNKHQGHLNKIFENIKNDKVWYLSGEDMRHIDALFSKKDTDKIKYIHIAKLISKQEFSSGTFQNIKEKSIEYFLQSNSWDSAYENAQFLIKPLINFFDEGDIKKILEKAFDKRGNDYNQILQAGNIGDIFIEIYQLSTNNFPELQKDWNKFVINLESENYTENFTDLIQQIKSEN